MRLNQLSADEVNHLVPGQRAIQDKLLGVDAAGATEYETITSGALSVGVPVTNLSVTGTQAYTLADGQYAGQEKHIRCTVAATIPAGTLTIASPETTAGLGCSATHFFDTVGQGLDLIWSGTKWRAKRVYRAGTSGANGVVVGSTALTGKLWINYCLSVTGTVVSSGANALPDGSSPGETININCTNAASIPAGTLNGNYRTIAGASATAASAIDATADTMSLMWDGTKWQVLYSTGITVS